jgi:predicted acyltransferase (DUF342 family)
MTGATVNTTGTTLNTTGGTVNISGGTGGVNITGATKFASETTINNNLNVTGNTKITGTTDISGKTTIDDDLDVTGKLKVTGTTNISGATTINNNLTVTGNTYISGDTYIKGTLNVPDHDMTVSKTLFLTNTSDVVSGSVAPPALVIGESGGTHLEFDGNEIMAKTTSALTNTDKLYLQSDGGYVIMSENAGRVGIGTSSPSYKLDVSGSIRATGGQLISTVATGTAPLSVTSTTVVTNLNADKLDGHDDSYFVNTGRSVSTASGLTGGDNLSADITIGLVATGTSGTYGPTADVTGNNNATIKVPQITTDVYGRVTGVTERTLTLKNTTYTFTDGNPTLAWGEQSKVGTVGGVDLHVTMPANPNTNTTYTIATGDSNGQIKVTPSPGTAYNVGVKGLGTAAYKAEGYFAGSGHTHSTYVNKTGDTMTGDLTVQGSI